MRYLFDCWNKIKKKVDSKAVALFLDFDGTLAPIADTPEKVIISPHTKESLNKISKNGSFRLAVISGRALSDIKRILGISGIIYVGNHGLEIEGPKIRYTIFAAQKYRAIVDKIKKELKEKTFSIKGVRLEDKGLTLSLHYRLASKKDTNLIRTIFYETTIVPAVKNIIKTTTGKMVLEVRPALDWDKGKVVLWLLARWKFMLKDRDIVPIYIGDDTTDEDAFRALKNKGVTIFVGIAENSSAQYYLKDTKEASCFLRKLLDLQKDKNGGFNQGKRTV
ncbi:MAG: trehalose-phosphatase [Candidatus Omnitrophota bacterium]|nr:trehalose-phosphatase [Candidatus Omnitrophota bacterium]